MRTVSVAAADREFCSLIEDVERGESVLITRRGRPVARLEPHMSDKRAGPGWEAAYRRMVANMEEGVSLGGLGIKRDELYDR